MARYDIPALLSKVKQTSQQAQVFYIGLNLGATMLAQYAAEYPEQAQQDVKLAVLLGNSGQLANRPSQFLAKASPHIWVTLISYSINFIYRYMLD